MSIYKELNEIELDLNEFEEIPVSKIEQKRILKKVSMKLSRPKKKWAGAAIAAVAVCALTLSLTLDKGTIASMPFVGDVIEKYINSNENLNYSSYKTSIGETAENALGKLTLNEVMVDDRQLFLSATFEPAENVDFDYQTTITPKVKINGEDLSVSTGSQSIEKNDTMFTVYNDVELSSAIETENVKIEISYDTWDFETVIEQPWTFQVEVSQEKLLAEKRIFDLNKTIILKNGDKVVIQKVVTTPISTAVYYDLSQSKSEDILMKIQSKEGGNETFSSAHNSNKPGDISVARFNGLSLGDQNYYLVLFNSEEETLSKTSLPIK